MLNFVIASVPAALVTVCQSSSASKHDESWRQMLLNMFLQAPTSAVITLTTSGTAVQETCDSKSSSALQAKLTKFNPLLHCASFFIILSRLQQLDVEL